MENARNEKMFPAVTTEDNGPYLCIEQLNNRPIKK